MEHYTYLAHYGIEGMKWGVRRFQNEDRSLTPEGRARYLGESTSVSNIKDYLYEDFDSLR